jgi:hypothetical protein
LAIRIEIDGWLTRVIGAQLAERGPAASLARLPPGLREAPRTELEGRALLLAARSLRRRRPLEPEADPAAAAFLDRVTGHLELLLDVAALAGAGADPERRRDELALLLAASAGRVSEALAADPGRETGGSEPAVERALDAAGEALRDSGWPPGDPRGGLPLSSAHVAVERRLLARLGVAYWRRGRLAEADVRRRLAQAGGELALSVEAIAGLATAAGALEPARRRQAHHQVARLGLPRPLERRMKAALRAPRGATALARAAPARLRRFLVEQVLRAEAASAPSAGGAAYADELAAAARIGADEVAAMRAEAAVLAAEQQIWLEAPAGAAAEWQAFTDQWGEVTDELLERVAGVVTQNLEAVAAEVRQTGQLGQLLAKAATGTPLSAEERRKVRLQLIDLAKAIPALAIFAAPGGMLLLPLLAKLLPFNVLPSAWDPKTVAERKALPGRKG